MKLNGDNLIGHRDKIYTNIKADTSTSNVRIIAFIFQNKTD